MLDFILLLAFLLPSSLYANDPEPASCYSTVKVCEDLKFETHDFIQDRYTPKFPPEADIGKEGHWGGARPVSYHLDFNFLNRTHHNGSATIKLQVVKPTTRIFLNQEAEHLAIDYERITVRSPCSIAQPSVGDQCIEKISYLSNDKVLVLEFRNFQLQANEEYDLVIPSFYPTPRGYDALAGTTGFMDRANEQSAILTTHFQMRHAREAFPCLDQIALKAVFHVCIEHPTKFLAASNGAPDKTRTTPAGPGRVKECFEPTPLLAPYHVTIVIMENYASETIQMPGEDFTLELFASKRSLDQYREFLNLSIPAIQYMTNITGFKFPMKRFGLLMAQGYVSGFEHMGLITMEDVQGPWEQTDDPSTLYHEIVHQWIGDLVTISNWNEICLQEGLTTYFEWTLMKRFRPSDPSVLESFKYNAEHERIRYAYYKENRTLLNDFLTAKSPCYTQAPIFFHTITKIMGGFHVFESFLASLIQKKPFGTADIDLWDETMGEVTNGKLKGYIKGWFNIAGPVYLLISSSDNAEEIVVSQRLYQPALARHWGFVEPDPAVPVPIDVQVIRANGTTDMISVALTESVQNIYIGPHESFLIDPETNTLAIKLYSAKHYLHLLKNEQQLVEQGLLNPNRLWRLFDDACFASTRGFPIRSDKDFNQSEWEEVLGARCSWK